MIYAYRKIVEKHQDMAGKWRVRVSIADTEAVFLKFDHEPTINEVKAKVAKYIENSEKQKVNELEMINSQIEELKARKTILKQEVSKP